MNIIDIIKQAQGGFLVVTIAAAAGAKPETVEAALDRLVPRIAGRIAEKARDPDDEEQLFEALDEGEHDKYLDQPRAAVSRAAIVDGEDILGHLFGSLERAQTEARRIAPPEGMSEDVFMRLMTLTATLTVAAMARRRQLLINPAATAPPPDTEAGSTLFSAVVSAVVTGLVQGIQQSLKRRSTSRRRRTTYGRRRKTSKRKRASTRGKNSPSITDLIGDILQKV